MQRRKSKVKVKTKRFGFTLAEVLVVVIVISTLAGLGGGIYVGTHKRMLVEKAARDFVLTAQYARIMAIEKQRQYKIQLDAANNGFLLATTQLDEEGGQTEQVIVQNSFCRPVEFEGEVRFEDIQITPIGLQTTTADDEEEQTIVFSPYGSAQSAVIQIGDGKTHYTVSIFAATGKAKVYFGTSEEVEIGFIDLDAE